MIETTYDDMIAAGAASLAEGELWMIGHADGLLPETASVDLTYPIRVFCDATGLDWDDAREQGYYLTRAGEKQQWASQRTRN